MPGPKTIDAVEEIVRSCKRWREQYQIQADHIVDKKLGCSGMGERVDGGISVAQEERIQEAILHDPKCQRLRAKLELVAEGVKAVNELDPVFGFILRALMAHLSWGETIEELGMPKTSYYRNKKRALIELAPHLFGEFGR